MTNHDVMVVGGSFAGLSATTYLARARRTVCVVDSGRPRNRFATAAHGVLGFDGTPPLDILERARKQVTAYGSVRWRQREAVSVQREDDHFVVTLDDGEEHVARKVVLAFGLHDVLPEIPGLKERWGHSVLHCPYCHGYEFRDRSLGVLYRAPMSVHQARLIAEWGPVTLYLNGAHLDPTSVAELAKHDVHVVSGRVHALEGDGASLAHAVLEDGSRHVLEALYVAPQSCLASPIAEQLGVALDDTPLGPVIRTDGDKQTSVPGVYAAGDIARTPHSVSWAVADGVTAGTAVHRALIGM
jgi:thioredoxin reductase